MAGVTLIELLVGLTVSAIVLSLALGLQLRVGSDARTLLQQSAERRMLAAARAYVRTEVRRAGEMGGGVLLIDPHDFVYHALRWVAAVCGWPTDSDSVRVLVRSDRLVGAEGPRAQRDSLAVWIDGYPADTADGQWLATGLAGVRAARCPDGGPALRLTAPGSALAVRFVHPGSPAAGFEPRRLRLYKSGDGTGWLGVQTRTESGWVPVQPAFGPLVVERSGFGYDARDGFVRVRLAAPLGDTTVFRATLRGRQ